MRELCLFLAIAGIVNADTIAVGERITFYLQDPGYLKSKSRSPCSICPDVPNKITWTLTTEELSGSLQGEIYTYEGELYHAWEPQDITWGGNPIGAISSQNNFIDVDWEGLTTGGRFRFDLINMGSNTLNLLNLWVQIGGQTTNAEGGIVGLIVGAKGAPAYEGAIPSDLRLSDPIEQMTPAPEPGAFVLLGLGLAGLLYYHRLHRPRTDAIPEHAALGDPARGTR